MFHLVCAEGTGWVWAVVLGGGGMLVECCHLPSLRAAISGVGLRCCLAFVLDGSGGLQQWWHYSLGVGYLVVVRGGGRRIIMVIMGLGYASVCRG